VKLSIRLRRLAYRCAYLLLWTFRVVVRPEVSGVKCVLTDGDHVLLVRHTYGPREWDLPGGGIKRGEGPATAARREMREELGVDIDDLRDTGSVVARLNRSRATVFCFTAELAAPAIAIERGEIAAARWFARGNLPPRTGRLVLPVLRRAGVRSAAPPASPA
jgi:ADP-ribose pyrophosphatase YjhB (NUDIX family)